MTVLQPQRYVALQRSTPARGTRRGGAPSHAVELAVGHLAVDVSHSALSPHLAACHVAVLVDDLPLQLPWGRTDVALPPGRHRVEIAVDRGDGWGRVVDAVPVAAGHTVDVFYRAPVLPVVAGALGPGAPAHPRDGRAVRGAPARRGPARRRRGGRALAPGLIRPGPARR